MNDTANKLALYHSRTSVCSQKVRLTLAELERDWESHELNLKTGDQFQPDYLQINPNGTVPTLLDGDTTITDSNDAIIHLCRCSCAEFLLPKDLESQIPILNWLEKSGELHSAVYVLTTLAMNRTKFLQLSKEEFAARIAKVPNRKKGALLSDTVKSGIGGFAVTDALNVVCNTLGKMNATLEAGKYLTGDKVSLADLALLPFVTRLDFLNLIPDWGSSSFEKLSHWQSQMMERPSYQLASRNFISDGAIANFQKAGTKAREDIIQSLGS